MSADNGQGEQLSLDGLAQDSGNNVVHDFSGVTDFHNARQAHAEKDRSLRDGLDGQGMNETVADIGQEVVRAAAVASAQRAKEAKSKAKPRRLTNRQRMLADVIGAKVKYDPGVHPPRLESVPDDVPFGPPVPEQMSFSEQEIERSRRAERLVDNDL